MNAAYVGYTTGVLGAGIVVVAVGGRTREARTLIAGIKGCAGIPVFAKSTGQRGPCASANGVAKVNGATISVVAGDGVTAIAFPVDAFPCRETRVVIVTGLNDGDIDAPCIRVARGLSALISVIAVVWNPRANPVDTAVFCGTEISIITGALVVGENAVSGQ